MSIRINITSRDASTTVELSDEIESSLESFVQRNSDGAQGPNSTVIGYLGTELNRVLHQVAEQCPPQSLIDAKAKFDAAQAEFEAAKAAAVNAQPVEV